jgi:hypothetical protein
MRAVNLVLAACLLAACSSAGGPGDDGGDFVPFPTRDGGPIRFDAGTGLGHSADGGLAPDGGSPEDGGLEDGGSPDGGVAAGDPCTGPACTGTQVLVCGTNGFFQPGEDCALRQMRCQAGVCTGCLPGARRCVGTTAVESCNADGETYRVVETCPSDRVCSEGQCVVAGPCGVGGKKSNQGCDYWAVDLPNADVTLPGSSISPATSQYAVVVSNTDENTAAQILITESTGGQPVTVVQDTVPPRDLKIFNLGPKNADQCGSSMGCANVGYRAYRIQSSIPVVAYQFNPLNNTEEAFSNDASLLLPSNALDQEYIIVTADAQAGQNRQGQTVPWGAFLSVVGTLDTPTSVTVTIPAGVLFDPPQGATVSGNIVTATLAKYQVLTILSRPPNSELNNPGNPSAGGGNLSGSRVTASGKVAVFSGNMAIVVPHGNDQKCCADHTEEQVYPLSTWGKEYVAVRSLPRRQGATPEQDVWRITASQNSTVFSYVTNAGSGLTGQPTSLHAGQSKEFRSTGDFIVSANAPFLLAHFMTSSNQAYDLGPFGIFASPCTRGSPTADQQCTQAYNTLARCADDGFGGGICQPVGDPSMTLIPPIRQFRQSYVFLTPLDYRTDFALIVAPQGTSVQLDGQEIPSSQFATVGSLGGVTFVRARIVLSTRGRHVLTASQAVGLIVGGYDRDVSYGYAGGLNLEGANPAADGGAL